MALLQTVLRKPRKRRTRVSPKTAPGSAPGTLVADHEAPPPVVRVIGYDGDDLVDETIDDLSTIPKLLDRWSVTWINIDGVGDPAVIEGLGKLFDLHPLALEDVANGNQRPKLEEYAGNVFIVARMPHLDVDGLYSEQLCLFLGANFVITFQERAGDCFEPVRKRIREGRRERFLKADYLAYALLDAIIDSFFPVLERFGERLEGLEEEIAANPRAEIIGKVHDTKHDLLALRRSIWPQRDLLNSLLRDPVAQVSDMTRTYFRDCYDHAVRIIDLVETYRELASGLTEFYQSTVGQRMNEIMKVLTVMATIFIPLTFVAGIYGMNFNPDASPWNMPELNWYWGYPVALLFMALLALAMLVYFRRKGWVG